MQSKQSPYILEEFGTVQSRRIQRKGERKTKYPDLNKIIGLEEEYLKRKKAFEAEELKDLKKQIDKPSDKFALGAELFQLVKGKVSLAFLAILGLYLGY